MRMREVITNYTFMPTGSGWRYESELQLSGSPNQNM